MDKKPTKIEFLKFLFALIKPARCLIVVMLLSMSLVYFVGLYKNFVIKDIIDLPFTSDDFNINLLYLLVGIVAIAILLEAFFLVFIGFYFKRQGLQANPTIYHQQNIQRFKFKNL